MNVFHREVGFVVAPGNPKGIRTVADLTKKGLRLINRQVGSGTRVLLDLELAKAKIDGRKLTGYAAEVCTHHEVALAVHSGEADVGIAASSAARLLDLGFVPLREERFDLVVDRAAFFEARIQALIDLLGSKPFHAQVSRLGGYDFRDCGKLLTRER